MEERVTMVEMEVAEKCFLKQNEKLEVIAENLAHNSGLACGLVEFVKEEEEEVIRQISDKGKGELCTTDAWNTIGLPLNVQVEMTNSKNYKDMVVGVVDAGICEHPAIFGPNQIRKTSFYLRSEEKDTSDNEKFHGTATAFILGGFASQIVHPLKSGLVRGGVPFCRLNIYKVHENLMEGIGASIDAALEDGVKMLNISMCKKPEPGEVPFCTEMSIGTFKAMLNGVLPCVGAGNYGPNDFSRNFGGWEFVVGGTDSETKYITELSLVSYGTSVWGQSLNLIGLNDECQLIHVKDVLGDDIGPRRKKNARGKVLVCEVYDYEEVPKTGEPQLAGLAGLVVILYGKSYSSFGSNVPSLVVTEEEGQTILQYMEDHKRNARVTIGVSVPVENPDFPSLAAFSLRLPGPFSRYLLKPDVSAQAVEVLCTLPIVDENHGVWQTFQSGTSIATPIVCAVAVRVSLAHPKWSASAIRSAIMTSADPMVVKRRSDVHGMGCGIVNGEHAVNPGLIYDLSPADYCMYALGLEECSQELRQFIHDEYNIYQSIHPLQFNYPSFKMTLRGKSDPNNTFSRTLTYVGSGPAVFKARVEGIDISEKRLKVTVSPSRLQFADENATGHFTMRVKVHDWSDEDDGLLYATLVWECRRSNYLVRSPIVVVRENNP